MEGEQELVLSAHPGQEPQGGWGGQARRDFIAGAVGGMAGVVAGQPLDTLRIRLQQRGCAARTAAGAWAAMRAGAEGARGLFRGMSYPLYTTALQNAVTFQAQRAGERTLAAAGAQPGLLATCGAGMFAGAVQTFISSPVELLKIRLQLQRARPGAADYVGPLGMLRRVVAQEGAAGLLRGCGVTLLRDTPSYGFYFVIYAAACSGLEPLAARLARGGAGTAACSAAEAPDRGGGGGGEDGGGAGAGSGGGGRGGDGRGIASDGEDQSSSSSALGQGGSSGRDGTSNSGTTSSSSSTSSSTSSGTSSSSSGGPSGGGSAAVQLLAGGLAGMLAWLSVYPLDLIKSRIQAQPAAASQYAGAWDCAVRSFREEGGAAVFTRGLGATLGRAFVVNAAIFACFEATIAAMAGAPAPAGAAAAAA
ncbi:mitochondrial arginine transporter [Raphidocelis subcapitata]|uniref:Mitochondrial arginine transporter n=1 Tax=Raphidocelis subcapitata TaxID=307507 RepID=A0A2V0PFJ7_9CHLO|nr:mitochondrial arginine transporter [Raphidocelis subcapitata]|eukprot:GBF97772.1 mitochondrial arginine transporter [Raphidocelis subcapitata]